MAGCPGLTHRNQRIDGSGEISEVVLIPVELRRILDLAEGTPLVARIEQDRLILERPDALLERGRARFASLPGGCA